MQLKQAIMGVALLLASWQASAMDFNWTGDKYIPVGVNAFSYTVVQFPEPIAVKFSEAPSRVEIKSAGDNRLIIRPTSDNPEQRLFVVGKKTNTLYIAKISTELPYSPIVRVHDAAQSAQERLQETREMTPVRLIKAMFLNEPPAGFAVAASHRLLLNEAPYRMTARSVWSSPSMVGIIAEVDKNTPAPAVQFDPLQIHIVAPQLGRLRLISADKWRLDNGINQRLTAYMVFVK